MIHFERALEFRAAPDEIWNVLGRFMHIEEFAPKVTAVEALTSGADGVGSKRRCQFEDGTSVVEEVTEWEDNKFYRVQLSEMEAMPLHSAMAQIEVKPLGEGMAKVIWGMDYHVKYGPLGWLLGQTMMKMMMGKILDGNLRGLAQKVEENRNQIRVG